MALEATHIRFAIELKDKLQVEDTARYIAGTLYPDSRYKTALPRKFTHPPDFKDWNLLNADDFKKGWFVHLLCDQIQAGIFNKKFPQFFLTGKIELGNDGWIALTAVKVLQDLEDIKKFDVKPYLPNLASIENRNNEKRELLVKFYKNVIDTYANPSKLTLENYRMKLAQLGIGEDLAAKVQKKAEQLSNDKGITKSVRAVYAEMMKKFGQMTDLIN